MRLSEADGRPVLSRSSAERVGELKHVVVDAATRRITAIHVAGRKKNAELIAWSDIVGFGPDGIVVADEEALRPPAEERERAVASGDLDLDGRLVLADDGVSPGVVGDVLFDESSGEITAILCGDEEIPGERLRTVGPYCVIVRAGPGAP